MKNQVELFVKNVNWNRLLLDRWGLSIKQVRKFQKEVGGYKNLNKCILSNMLSEKNFVRKDIGNFLRQTYPDTLPDKTCIWHDSIGKVLRSQGVASEKTFYWISVYDAYGKALPIPIERRFDEMDSLHICKILKDYSSVMSSIRIEALNNVLNKRHGKITAWMLKILIKNTNNSLYRNFMVWLSKIKKS